MNNDDHRRRRIREGTITLPYGKHEVSIDTGCQPEKVYTTIDDKGTGGCCNGDLNTSTTTLTPTGFTIAANITSNEVTVFWVAETRCS